MSIPEASEGAIQSYAPASADASIHSVVILGDIQPNTRDVGTLPCCTEETDPGTDQHIARSGLLDTLQSGLRSGAIKHLSVIYGIDANTRWDVNAVPKCQLIALAEKAAVTLVLTMAEDYTKPEENSAAAFMYIPPNDH